MARLTTGEPSEGSECRPSPHRPPDRAFRPPSRARAVARPPVERAERAAGQRGLRATRAGGARIGHGWVAPPHGAGVSAELGHQLPAFRRPCRAARGAGARHAGLGHGLGRLPSATHPQAWRWWRWTAPASVGVGRTAPSCRSKPRPPPLPRCCPTTAGRWCCWAIRSAGRSWRAWRPNTRTRVTALVLLAASLDPAQEEIHPMQWVGAWAPVRGICCHGCCAIRTPS